MRPSAARPDTALLLAALRRPDSMLALDLDAWDLLIRAARRAKLLATLHGRLRSSGTLEQVPAAVARHLSADFQLYEFRRRKALAMLSALTPLLSDLAHPLLLLKGTAYVCQQMPLSVGRLFSDVDILVPRTALDVVEQQLLRSGWKFTLDDAYDQRYYREWSHELPPLLHPNHVLTLDVHHTILPVTGKARIDSTALLRDAIRLPDTPWHVLDPADQFMHACLHMFQDSDCVDRLREIVDLDMLIRTHSANASFWPRLCERALRIPGAGRAIWYGLRYSQLLLGTPVPANVMAELIPVAPGAAVRRWMDHAIGEVLFGPHPDAINDKASFLSSTALKARAMQLRMPLHLLLQHATVKFLRSLTSTRSG